MSMDFLPQPKTLNEYEVVEHEFAMAFAHYVNLYNMMERNLGLCIRSEMVHPEFRITDKQLDNLSFHGKLERLTKLVDQSAFNISKKGLKKDYGKWLQLVNETRATRNQYIHGDWDIYPSVERPVRFTPMVWVERQTKSCTEQMTLNEFLTRMTETDQVFKGFSRLRKTYGI